MSRTFNLAWRYCWDPDPEACLNRSVELALRAVECDDLDPHAHATLGYAYLFRNDHAAALAAYERAVELNPNDVARRRSTFRRIPLPQSPPLPRRRPERRSCLLRPALILHERTT